VRLFAGSANKSEGLPSLVQLLHGNDRTSGFVRVYILDLPAICRVNLIIRCIGFDSYSGSHSLGTRFEG
jgi:hypothetical protein